MKTRTRYHLTTGVLLFLALMSMAAMIVRMEVLSVTCVTGMMTTLSTYIWAQTKRPSRTIGNEIIEEQGLEQQKEDENDTEK